MISGALSLAGVVWVVAIVGMAALFPIAWSRGKTGLVDVAWSYGVGFAGAAFALFAEGALPARRYVVAGLILVWCLRLGTMLLRRVLGSAEDGRYAAMMEHWGDRAKRNMFLFYQAQALWVMLFALPILFAVLANDAPLHWTDALGVLIGFGAIGGESLADHQLSEFKKDPGNKGKVMDRGLWAWSRHPNYFFEWTFWFSFVAIGLGSPYGWISLAGPLVMGTFLWRVTGIPYTEKQAIKSRGDAYREYQRTTSAFFPWPPKESST